MKDIFKKKYFDKNRQTTQSMKSNPAFKEFNKQVLLHFSLTVKAATLIFISGCGLAISTAKEGKSGFIYNFVKSK